jgi:peptide deformylase
VKKGKRHIREFGDPVLRQKAAPVSREAIESGDYQSLIENMVELMRQEQGIGIAAPQVGESIRLFIANISGQVRGEDGPYTVIFNPEIISYTPEIELDWEGCLSLPDVRGLVPRWKSVVVSYLDKQGQAQEEGLTDLPARVFQHELDHLDGILFVDRMKDMKSLMTYREWDRQYGQNEES